MFGYTLLYIDRKKNLTPSPSHALMSSTPSPHRCTLTPSPSHALTPSPSHALMNSTPSPHRCTLTPSPSHALMPSPSHALLSNTPSPHRCTHTPSPSHALTGAPSRPHHLTPSPVHPHALMSRTPSPHRYPRRQICTPAPGVGDGQAAIVWRRCPLRMSAFSARFQVKIVLFSVTYRQKKVARSHNFELYERAF